tara:strand:+ start:112 stop:321 length:210 start_codon:yes stop_codon:yes gene_type:complete
VANLSDNKSVYNKAFSYKGISGGNMRVGTLVRYIYGGELWIVTAFAHGGYVEVSGQWLVPEEHLEVLCK